MQPVLLDTHRRRPGHCSRLRARRVVKKRRIGGRVSLSPVRRGSLLGILMDVEGVAEEDCANRGKDNW
jgi:hypothetical protein